MEEIEEILPIYPDEIETIEEKEREQTVICIGDVHGHLSKLTSLWKNLEDALGSSVLSKAVIVFLGDLNDRGPNTKGVIDWIIQLQQKRLQKRFSEEEKEEEKKEEEQEEGEKEKEKEKEKKQKKKWAEGDVVILAGNHDFGMASYLGCPPLGSSPTAEELDQTKNPQFRSGFYPHPVHGGMHYQGRRWGGSYVYNAQETFRSYGVKWENAPASRDKFIEAVPPSHRQFLSQMDWVYDIEVPWPPYRLICCHAGLPNENKRKIELVLKGMKERDMKDENVHGDDVARFPFMHGRKEVIRTPTALAFEALIVSGHHGNKTTKSNRIIIDTSGGKAGIPLEAVVLPHKIIVTSSQKKEKQEN